MTAYGLRRLFRQGQGAAGGSCRPPVDLFLGTGVRSGTTSPLMLFDVRDVLGVASDLRAINSCHE